MKDQVIAKLICDSIFFEMENYKKTWVVDQIEQLERKMKLSNIAAQLNPTYIIKNMLELGLIHQTGIMRGEPIYSKFKTKEIRTYN